MGLFLANLLSIQHAKSMCKPVNTSPFRGDKIDGNHVLVVAERNSQLVHPHCCLGSSGDAIKCNMESFFLSLTALWIKLKHLDISPEPFFHVSVCFVVLLLP